MLGSYINQLRAEAARCVMPFASGDGALLVLPTVYTALEERASGAMWYGVNGESHRE